ncbi:hypothetical protein LTR17_006833 [Elasticomyces elasticus]|nr:hypothetical protein LTR17_006833 [Elasticomyces elasticus]
MFDGLVGRSLTTLAKILQSLIRYPHPNLVKFYGCVLKGDRIAGLVLEKYPTTLEQYFLQDQNDIGEFDAEAWMQGLRAGIQHLHSLRLAYNDLNPINVALDGSDNVVKIDLGSFRRFSEDLISASTLRWFNEDSPGWAISVKAYDDFGLMKLEQWLDGKRSESLARKRECGASGQESVASR